MLRVLAIGDPCFEPLRALAGDAIRFAPTPSAAIGFCESAFLPELIITAEDRPGQIPLAAFAALRARYPLARLWRVLGNWCEGEARSGRPPAGCLASYGHDWPVRAAREAAAIARGEQPCWNLPLTAAPEEHLLAQFDRQAKRSRSLRAGAVAGTIAVRGASAAAVAALMQVCRQAGYSAVAWPEHTDVRPQGAYAIVWDTTPRAMQDPASVAILQQALPDKPILAIASFPRRDDITAARKAGIAAVIAKPFLVADLVQELNRIVPTQTFPPS